MLAETKELFDSVDRAVFGGFSEQQLEQLASLLDRMCLNLRGIAPADALEHDPHGEPPHGMPHGGKPPHGGAPHGGESRDFKPHCGVGSHHGGERNDE